MAARTGTDRLADNRNQHFVPKVHFKPFSVGGHGGAIQIFNLDRRQAIPNASVKKQCSGGYFYGHNKQLEKAIQTIEGAYGQMLRRLLPPEAEPAAVDCTVLRRFMLLQNLRTEAAAASASQVMAAMARFPGSIPEGEAFDIKEAMRLAVGEAMLVFARSMKVVDDLRVTIVRNRSLTPFITSDDPAVLTNRWYLQNPRARGLPFSLRNAGMILLMPLSPATLVMLHDPEVYTVGHRRGVVWIDEDADAEALNAHQILNCAANLYFRDWETRDRVCTSVTATLPERPDRRHRTTYAVRGEVVGDHVRYDVRPFEEIAFEGKKEVLIHTEVLRPRPSRWPSFLDYRRDGRAYSNGSRTGFVRRGCLDAGFVQGAGYRRIKFNTHMA
jgi:hypothetical protein